MRVRRRARRCMFCLKPMKRGGRGTATVGYHPLCVKPAQVAQVLRRIIK